MEHLTEKIGQELEDNYVKSTYDNIAEEFSCTRYKKWPKVETFLKNLPNDSLLLDIGCGNGKYLDNSLTFNIGCDASSKLLSICRSRGFEVVLCDMMRLPFRNEVFDSIICIAALHHIVTAQRRQKCLEGIVNLISNNNNSKLLIQVWSYEQDLDKDNPYLKRKANPITEAGPSVTRVITINEKTEIPIHQNRTAFKDQDLLVPFKVKRNPNQSKLDSIKEDEDSSTTNEYLRYYHVFKEKELDSMIDRIPNTKIIESYYDRGNWCSVVGYKENSSCDNSSKN